MASGDETTKVELESGECALIVGEDDGAITVRIVASADMPTEGTDLAAAPEIVIALAKRLLKDPDFQDDVLDWYYDHQENEEDDDEDEDEE
jgi:hypothetical protein